MTPIIVCGVGRSGTSLLQAVLAAHPTIAGIPETGFFRRYCTNRLLERAFSRSGADGVLSILQDDQRFERLANGNELARNYLSNGQDFRSEDLYTSMLRSHAVPEQHEYVCDKDPRLIEFLPHLSRVFGSSCRIIHIVRDPRAVVASKKKARWSQNQGMIRQLTAGRTQYLLGCREGRELFGANYIELTYEELTSEPETTLRSLAESLEIDFSSDMLDPTRRTRTLVSDDEKEWKENVFKPISVSGHDKWKRELSSREVAAVELVSRDMFDDGGYESSNAMTELGLADRCSVYTTKAIVTGMSAMLRMPMFRRS